MDSVPQPAERRHVGVPTVLAALVLLAFTVLAGWLHETGSRVEGVAEPERALALIVGRTLDLDEGVEQAPAWERRFYRLMLGDRADDLAEAIRWFDELARYSLDPAVDLHLAILEAEVGRFERVRGRVEEWRRRDEPFPTLAGLIAAAYLGGAPAPGVEARAALRAALQAGWFSDRLAIRLAARAGDTELGETARAALEARGGRLLARLRGFAAAEAGVLVAGAFALVHVARRRREATRLGSAALPPPWPGRTGVVVLLQGGAVGALALGAFQFLPLLVPARPLTRVMVATLTNLAFVPLLVLARRRLLVPAGVGFGPGLGLVPSPGAAVPLAVVLLALLGTAQVGEWALGWGAHALDLSAHWTEWFDRDLAWGSAPVLALELFDTVVLAPVVEEIVFRGLLFATLRARLGLGAAAALSAAIFALAHGYGAAGFAAVFWSGLLWAVAYERTGSLLPSIAAHAVDNLGASLALLLVLRG